MDVADDDNIAETIRHTAETFGKIDFLLHSVAFASVDDLKGETINTSREGFKMAMEISAYSLLAVFPSVARHFQSRRRDPHHDLFRR